MFSGIFQSYINTMWFDPQSISGVLRSDCSVLLEVFFQLFASNIVQVSAAPKLTQWEWCRKVSAVLFDHPQLRLPHAVAVLQDRVDERQLQGAEEIQDSSELRFWNPAELVSQVRAEAHSDRDGVSVK